MGSVLTVSSQISGKIFFWPITSDSHMRECVLLKGSGLIFQGFVFIHFQFKNNRLSYWKIPLFRAHWQGTISSEKDRAWASFKCLPPALDLDRFNTGRQNESGSYIRHILLFYLSSSELFSACPSQSLGSQISKYRTRLKPVKRFKTTLFLTWICDAGSSWLAMEIIPSWFPVSHLVYKTLHFPGVPKQQLRFR